MEIWDTSDTTISIKPVLKHVVVPLFKEKDARIFLIDMYFSLLSLFKMAELYRFIWLKCIIWNKENKKKKRLKISVWNIS